MTNLKLTKHAAERMAERSISWHQVTKVLLTGTTRHTPHGMVTQIGWLSKALDNEYEALSGISVVWSEQSIVTVYRS